MRTACNTCHVIMPHYFLKDGACNGCRNPHLIVESITIVPHPPEVIDADPALIADMKRRLAEPKRESEPESIFERD